jgi:hypothetical protein
VFCFRGYLAMRIVIPIWGAFAGFVLGASVVDAFDDNEFLSTVLGWLLGIVLAFVFAALAYLYYEVAVVLAFASIGFTFGSSLMAAFNIDWNWLIVLVGIAIGVLFAIVALMVELPMVLLVVLTTIAGAITMTGGGMLLVGELETAEWNSDTVIELIDDRWWWWVIALVLAIAGFFAQMKTISQLRWNMHAAWDNSPTPRRAAAT